MSKKRKDFRVHVLVSDKTPKSLILILRVGEFTEALAKKSCIAEAQRLHPTKKFSIVNCTEIKRKEKKDEEIY